MKVLDRLFSFAGFNTVIDEDVDASDLQQPKVELEHSCDACGFDGCAHDHKCKCGGNGKCGGKCKNCHCDDDELEEGNLTVRDSEGESLASNMEIARGISKDTWESMKRSEKKKYVDKHPNSSYYYEYYSKIYKNKLGDVKEQLKSLKEAQNKYKSAKRQAEIKKQIDVLKQKNKKLNDFMKSLKNRFNEKKEIVKEENIQKVIKKDIQKNKPEAKKDLPLQGKVFCMTGFRDADLKNKIEDAGGIVKDSFTKDVNVLLSNINNSTKTKLAKERGIEVVPYFGIPKFLRDFGVDLEVKNRKLKADVKPRKKQSED